jgi:fructosamine-3-kinase
VTLPAGVRAAVERALDGLGAGSRIVRDSPVGGGCISPAAHIETDGGRFFLKWTADDIAPGDFFTSQAGGLRALERAGAVRVPRVIAAASRWLLLEWLDPGRATRTTWRSLGEQLAGLHRGRRASFGAEADNYIGSLPQANGARDRWPAFWADQRIGPQWQRARRDGFFDGSDERAFVKLLAALDGLLAAGDAEGPSLVHGDLWGGNVHVMSDGGAALIDPAVYRGHREVDLAMAELFGGFERAFFDAYREAWPLHPGYEEERRAVYQLYYLLVHVNLFGSSYAGAVRRVLRRYSA